MGGNACTILTEDLSCEEMRDLLCRILEARQSERTSIGRLISRKTAELLKQKNTSSDLIRKELADWVRKEVLKKTRGNQHRRK
jgi:hypothetical protein